MEMNVVADMFNRNGEGYIDWKEFLAALRPDWEEKPTSNDDIILDEVQQQVQLCSCHNRLKVNQVNEGQYRVKSTINGPSFDYSNFYSLLKYSLVTVRSSAWSAPCAPLSWSVSVVAGWRWTSSSSRTILVVVRFLISSYSVKLYKCGLTHH